MSVVCLIECMANIAMSVTYIIADEWVFGYIICYINRLASLMQCSRASKIV